MPQYSIDDILQAKRIARQAGYNVSLPDNKLDTAMNIAREAGYNVRKAVTDEDRLALAKQVATNAGYNVVKTNARPTQTTQPAQTKPAPTPAPKTNQSTPAAPKKQQDHEYSWAEKIASKYL